MRTEEERPRSLAKAEKISPPAPQGALRRRAGWPWIVLAGLLALLTAGAATFDRSAWPSVMGDEATYLMQAESLAWDADVGYSLGDYRRFVDHWGRKPQGLILQSGDDGAHVIYGKPFFYALYLAPFVRLSPARGPFVANALLLALACLAAARTLARRVGPLAPLWVAAFVFASVTFAHTFWAHPDLFLMCLTALALALAFGPPGREEARTADRRDRLRAAVRWGSVGVLLAIVGFSRPPYLSLFLPALLAVPRRRRGVGVPALLAGGLLLVLAAGAVHQSLSGSWTSYGAERMGFYRHTGFPEVDFRAGDWGSKIEELGNVAAARPSEVPWGKRLVPSLWGWNAVYFLAGRHLGLLPYFLPLVLGLGGGLRDRRAWSLLLAVALGCGAFLLLRPFNFYGGGGAIANRYFLPLYPALWFLARRPLRLRWLVAVSAVAALFVGELWLAPRSYPIERRERTYRYVSPAAERLLPFETTQSHLKIAGREDLYSGIFVRLLDHHVRPAETGLELRGGVAGRLLLGSVEPLAAVDLEVEAAAGVEVDAGRREVERLGGDGGVRRFRVRLGRPRARHPMWWTWDPVSLYFLELRFDGVGEEPVGFRISAGPSGS